MFGLFKKEKQIEFPIIYDKSGDDIIFKDITIDPSDKFPIKWKINPHTFIELISWCCEIEFMGQMGTNQILGLPDDTMWGDIYDYVTENIPGTILVQYEEETEPLQLKEYGIMYFVPLENNEGLLLLYYQHHPQTVHVSDYNTFLHLMRSIGFETRDNKYYKISYTVENGEIIYYLYGYNEGLITDDINEILNFLIELIKQDKLLVFTQPKF